ncbi:reverse transcriptase domain-containing protein [Tanacetum coccineum]
MEDEFYHLTVKGNDLKEYVRRFQELATLCPTMVPDSEKMMEVFIRGLPQSIEGNVTASKPQTLEEAINIAQRLMDQNRRQETFRSYAVTPTENGQNQIVPLRPGQEPDIPAKTWLYSVRPGQDPDILAKIWLYPFRPGQDPDVSC